MGHGIVCDLKIWTIAIILKPSVQYLLLLWTLICIKLLHLASCLTWWHLCHHLKHQHQCLQTLTRGFSLILTKQHSPNIPGPRPHFSALLVVSVSLSPPSPCTELDSITVGLLWSSETHCRVRSHLMIGSTFTALTTTCCFFQSERLPLFFVDKVKCFHCSESHKLYSSTSKNKHKSSTKKNLKPHPSCV